MAKNKKRKKPVPQPEMGGYKHFLKGLSEVLSDFNLQSNLSSLSDKFKRSIYNHMISIRNPQAGNSNITPNELKSISEKIKKYYRKRSIEIEDKIVSNYHLQLFYTLLWENARESERRLGDKEHPDVVNLEECSDKVLKVFMSYFIVDSFRIVTQLSNPDQKYYSILVDLAPICKKNPKIEVTISIYSFPVPMCMMKTGGIYRPAFRLGKQVISAEGPLQWVTVDASLLGNLYKGDKTELDVYIQSHALRRMGERLDLLSQEAINYALWENINKISHFESSAGYRLLPFKIFGIKIGYLVANLVDGKILFQTFLFITHNSTPEGIRLKKLTGLGKEDITYWRIDRLSTFVNFREEENPGLTQLFDKAGLGILKELRSKKFDIDSMQTANLEGLAEYIRRGQTEHLLMNLDWDTPVSQLVF